MSWSLRHRRRTPGPKLILVPFKIPTSGFLSSSLAYPISPVIKYQPLFSITLQSTRKGLLIIPTSDPEPSEGFPNYPANRGSLRSQSLRSHGIKLESATHIGDHPKITDECWKGDHVGYRQPACSCCPPEIFVAVCLHVCGPIASASVRLPTHRIPSLPRIFETTSNVSVGEGAILLYLTSPGSIARAVVRTCQRSSSRSQELDWGDETDSYCGLP